jgi:indole-3-glycerol phosphate synthase
MNKLEEICATKRDEVRERQSATQVSELIARIAAQAPPRGFEAALRKTHADSCRALIAEIKRASPSKGLIREDFQPAEHAKAYAAAGASCLSVLTDAPYFQGHADYLIAARQACDLPALRKDFMVDPWQCGEARAMGADAILIIVAALTDQQAQEIEAAADELGMDVLVEVHDAAEMERAHKLKSRLIGINNRDLRSFTTDIATTEALIPIAPEGAFLISESGIGSAADCARLELAGAHGFLVGESLMRHPDVEAATRDLLKR